MRKWKCEEMLFFLFFFLNKGISSMPPTELAYSIIFLSIELFYYNSSLCANKRKGYLLTSAPCLARANYIFCGDLRAQLKILSYIPFFFSWTLRKGQISIRTHFLCFEFKQVAALLRTKFTNNIFLWIHNPVPIFLYQKKYFKKITRDSLYEQRGRLWDLLYY